MNEKAAFCPNTRVSGKPVNSGVTDGSKKTIRAETPASPAPLLLLLYLTIGNETLQK